MNRGYVKHFSRKLWIWSIIISMVVLPVSGVSAQAENWSQYAKLGITMNDKLGSFNLPVSVSVYGSNSVYVADSNNHRIQRLNVSTGEWSEWKKIGGGAGSGFGEFNTPSGVAVDGSGNVYVADTNNHRIQKLDASTNTWSSWSKADGSSGSGLGEFKSPRGVDVDPNGNVYVADTDNHRIQKLDVSTNTWSEWKKSGGGSGTNLGQFNFPRGVTVDGGGNVYVADSRNNRIQKLDFSTVPTGEWKLVGGTLGSGVGQFKNLSDVTLDTSGNIYVADTGNHRIQMLDVSTNSWSEWKKSGGGPGSELGEFRNPYGVAVNESGEVYAADSENHRIQKLDGTAGNWSNWGYVGAVAGDGLGEFAGVTGVATDDEGNVYAADYNNHRIQKQDALTGTWSAWGKIGGGSGIGLGEFENPTGVAVDSNGNVYAADRYNHRIQRLDVGTGMWSQWGKAGGGQGSGPGEFEYPGSVAVDNDGNVYVADTNNFRIQKLEASTGTWRTVGGGIGRSAIGEFNYPFGVAVDRNKNIYVSDTDNHRIQKLDISKGEWEEVGNGEGSGLGEFYEPHGLTVDANGDIYVADLGNHRIQKLDITNGVWSEWSKSGGAEGSSLGEFSSPTGVAIDRSEKIYVADFGNNRIQKWVYAAPSAPINAAATAGNGEATISFAVPSTDGGSVITGYTVTANPGGLTAIGSGSPIKMTGLTNGQSYTFTVIASNRSGDSPSSVATNAVTPMTYPDEPTGVTATAGNGEATVSFIAPSSDGGSAITGYTVTSNPGGVTANGTGSPIKVTGLTNDTAYTFTVIAINEVGNSAASTASVAVIPQSAPINNGGGSSPSQPAPSTAPEAGPSGSFVLINGKSQNLGSAKVTKVDSQTVTTITVDQKKLESLLAAEAHSAVVTIQSKANSDVIIAELNGQIIHELESRQAVLELQTDKAIYRLPALQIDIGAIADQFGKSIALENIRFQIEIAVPKEPLKWTHDESAGGKIAFVVPQLDFSVRAIYLNESINVSEFDAYVERSIAIPAGVDASKMTTGVVIEADGTLRHVPTKIVVRDGVSYAKVSSLTNSVYSLIWHPLAFKDAEGHWAKQAVNDLGSRLIVKGDANGMFNPNQEVTRAEFAAILIRALGLQPKVQGTSFVDVAPNSWFAGDLGTASHYRLISGFGDGTMRPNDKMTREQAMTLLARAMLLTKLKEKTSPAAGQALDAFTDKGAVSSWAKEGIIDSLSYGLVTGRNGNELAPDAFITRAEVAVLVQKLLSKSDLI
ncbi:hypothetical protein BBD42_19905 [Paenibacillus sp. BIHB 4019]|uniref:Uncharacterized protein n=1 Tax=Paenibacillus sp. BIHB 4019 TaxID=1870819 RepID=A0A1B2DLA5_9BACL|nr:S-layer homology domain-containing protein [Paenibacillus sp. BIHB 4019]ANY68485.1 hypothetical protein BBD42_19905 [Paenibacillus sp. BIHB 4019]